MQINIKKTKEKKNSSKQILILADIRLLNTNIHQFFKYE
jgi:hypothetical protein